MIEKKDKKLKILFQNLSINTVYAGRTIYNGYRNAFLDMGHEFKTLTADDNMGKVLEEFKPDIFFTGLSSFSLKYLDLDVLQKYRKKGLKVFVNVPAWRSSMSRLRINECPGLKNSPGYVELIRSGKFGDVYYNSVEADDERIKGFEEGTGAKYHTIPLAADKTLLEYMPDNNFTSDIAYIGTNLPEKRDFFRERVAPLSKKYDVKLYGQDWTAFDRGLGWIQRFGQYFNIHTLSGIRKPKLALTDEAKIYSSSKISINVHEDYQKRCGGDCNERTFKIPLCGGFEITDDVKCVGQYFVDGQEMIIAKNKDDWFNKIEYYIKNPEKRIPIIEAGMKKVLKEHTYHNRVNQIINIYNEIK